MKLQLLAIAAIFASSAFAQVDRCGALVNLKLPDTKITAVQVVESGAFAPPAAGGRGPSPIFKTLPAFCRVAMTLTPTSDSDIKSEVWMPVSGWNGMLQVVGNGGWAGTIGFNAMAQALAAGYATAGTDTGHTVSDASFAWQHPEKMLDFGWRALHVTTEQAKSIVKSFNGGAIRSSIYNGCSTGGRQGLNEVQRFPADFDGVIAGAPVNPMTRLHAASLHNSLYAHEDPANYIPPAKYPMIHKAVLEACDALDGVKDGLIENPMACHFDPKVLLCKGADGPECLTAAQVGLANQIYDGTFNPRTKEQLFPGWERGSELGWGVTAGPEPEGPAISTFRYVVFQNPDWDWHTLNLDSDIALADKMGAAQIDADETDLTPFVSRGGKLLLFHGWSDPNVAPRNTVNYYTRVLKATGTDKAADSIRLFMVPGMGHCGGGEGPNTFDKAAEMAQWLTTGKAPEQVIASHSTGGKVDRTRPLCAFPKIATYKGTGSIDDAANFSCALPAAAR